MVSKGNLSCSFLSPGSQAQQVRRDVYSSSFLSVTCSESLSLMPICFTRAVYTVLATCQTRCTQSY